MSVRGHPRARSLRGVRARVAPTLVASAVQPSGSAERRGTGRSGGLAAEALLNRVEPPAVAVVLGPALAHGRQNTFGRMQERRRRVLAVGEHDEASVRLLFGARIR